MGMDKLVALVHEDLPALRRMAVFDIIVYNAGCKGDHVLAMTDGHRHGVDHGLTFHCDHKVHGAVGMAARRSNRRGTRRH